jgi:hypothetical protein
MGNEEGGVDWLKRADAAIANLNKGGRAYPVASVLAVIDDIVSGLKPVEIVQKRNVKSGRITTALGHVTTAVHGRGPVPSLAEGGWYERGTYAVARGFAAAWKVRRPTGGITETAPVAVERHEYSARAGMQKAAPIDLPPARPHFTPAFEKPHEELFTSKPTIWGMSVNLKEAWRRFRRWLRGGNR